MSTKKIDRLLHLIRYIHFNPGTGIGELCAKFGLSPATLYRYIRAVETLSVKIEFIKTGYYITRYGILNEGAL